MMNYEEMQKLLEHNAEKQNDVRVPNEIFDDLVSCELLKVEKNHGRANHMAFAFSYFYLITYLYRECKFDYIRPLSTKDLKRMLGYGETNKRLDYIIKKGGVLDQMGYTETTFDYPVRWYIEDKYCVQFETYSNYSEEERKEYKDFLPRSLSQ